VGGLVEVGTAVEPELVAAEVAEGPEDELLMEYSSDGHHGEGLVSTYGTVSASVNVCGGGDGGVGTGNVAAGAGSAERDCPRRAYAYYPGTL
jgi:hypothetical protein